MAFEQELANYINGIDDNQLKGVLEKYFIKSPTEPPVNLTIDPTGYTTAINALGVFRHLMKGPLPPPKHIAVVCNIISAGISAFLSSIVLGPWKSRCAFPNSNYLELFNSLIKSFLGQGSLVRGSLANITGFAPQYYEWLNQSSSARAKGITVGVAKTKVPEYVTDEHMYTLFCNQLGFDVNLLLTAISQRQVIPGPYVVNPYSLRDDLAELDCYANQMVQNAVDAGLFDDLARMDGNGFIMTGKNNRAQRILEPRPIIITYVSKMPTSRVIPYSPIVLLGLPSDYFLASQPKITDNTRLLSAINHEIGRLVFWRGYCTNIPFIGPDADEKRKAIDTYLGRVPVTPPLKKPIANKSHKALVGLNRYLRMMQFSPWVADCAEQIVADVYTAMHSSTEDAMKLAFYRTKSMIMERSFYDKLRYQLPIELRPEIFLYIRQRIASSGGTDPAITEAEDYWWRTDGLPSLATNRYGAHVDNTKKWGWRAELFGPEVNNIHLDPNNVKPYGIENGLSFEIAKEELLKVTEIVFQMLGGTIKAKNGATPTLNYKGTSPTYYFNPPSMHVYWNNPMWENWAYQLVEEEQDMRNEFRLSGLADPYGVTRTSDDELNFYTLLYAGGWIVQSIGNSSGPH